MTTEFPAALKGLLAEAVGSKGTQPKGHKFAAEVVKHFGPDAVPSLFPTIEPICVALVPKTKSAAIAWSSIKGYLTSAVEAYRAFEETGGKDYSAAIASRAKSLAATLPSFSSSTDGSTIALSSPARFVVSSHGYTFIACGGDAHPIMLLRPDGSSVAQTIDGALTAASILPSGHVVLLTSGAIGLWDTTNKVSWIREHGGGSQLVTVGNFTAVVCKAGRVVIMDTEEGCSVTSSRDFVGPVHLFPTDDSVLVLHDHNRKLTMMRLSSTDAAGAATGGAGTTASAAGAASAPAAAPTAPADAPADAVTSDPAPPAAATKPKKTKKTKAAAAAAPSDADSTASNPGSIVESLTGHLGQMTMHE